MDRCARPTPGSARTATATARPLPAGSKLTGPSSADATPSICPGCTAPPPRPFEAGGADIGLILQPGSHLQRHAPQYRYWAADNGCYTSSDRFDADRWFAWLAGLPDVARRRRCLFATAPDVLCDADATWRRSWPWLPLIRALGIPAAIVGQNGVESHAPTWDNDHLWDVMFIGGDSWKCSEDARDVVQEAQLRGKWVHVGRVNSWRRLDLVADWDVDSVDGTYLRFGPDTNGRQLARWLARLEREPTLF